MRFWETLCLFVCFAPYFWGATWSEPVNCSRCLCVCVCNRKANFYVTIDDKDSGVCILYVGQTVHHCDSVCIFSPAGHSVWAGCGVSVWDGEDAACLSPHERHWWVQHNFSVPLHPILSLETTHWWLIHTKFGLSTKVLWFVIISIVCLSVHLSYLSVHPSVRLSFHVSTKLLTSSEAGCYYILNCTFYFYLVCVCEAPCALEGGI